MLYDIFSVLRKGVFGRGEGLIHLSSEFRSNYYKLFKSHITLYRALQDSRTQLML